MASNFLVAIELSIPVTERAIEAQRRARGALGTEVELLWEPPERLCVPLRLIHARYGAAYEVLSDCARRMVEPLFAFRLGLSGLCETGGRFLWAECDREGGEVVGLLRRALSKELAAIGVAEDARPFEARMLLGRVLGGPAAALAGAAEQASSAASGSGPVRELVVWESWLGRAGMERATRGRFALGGG